MDTDKLADVPAGPELGNRDLRRGFSGWSTNKQSETTLSHKLPREMSPDTCLPRTVTANLITLKRVEPDSDSVGTRLQVSGKVTK